MATEIAKLIFSSIPDGFFPAPPAGWGKPTTDTTRILSGYFIRSGSTPAVFRYNTPFATNEIEVSVRLPPSLPVTSLTFVSRSGGQFIDSTGNGYAIFYRLSGGNIIASVSVIVAYLVTTEIFTNTFTQAGNLGKELRLRRNRSTGVMKVILDASQLGADVTDTTYNPNYGAAIATVGDSGVHTITLTDLASYQVNSFNAVNPIERGQQNVVYDTTGFASITSITTNQTGVTVNGIADTSGDGNADISDYVEGGLYPVLPTSVIYTFGDGANSAQITKTLTVKASDSSVVTSGMVTINDSWLGYLLQNAGRSVADGGQIIWPTASGITIGQDGSINNPSGVETLVNLWYRDPVNGRVYNYDLTISGTGEVVSFASTSTIGIYIGIGI